MTFLDIFETDAPENIFDETCKRAKPGADKITYKQFEHEFDKNIDTIKNKINHHSYKFTRFEVFLKTKKHYQLPRLIFKSSIRDKLVAKLMCQYILSVYASNGYIPSKTRDSVLDQLVTELKRKENNSYVFQNYLRLDISSFFDAINRHLLMSQLKEDNMDEDFIYLIEKLFYTMDLSMDIPSGKGVPQGISISSILAERYLKDLDKEYSKEYYQNKVIFIRYVDDILVFVDSDSTLKEIKQWLIFTLQSTYGLTINTDKMSYGSLEEEAFDFLGIRINNRKIAVSENQYTRITQQINELFKWYKRSLKNKSHPFSNTADDRIINSLLEKLNLLITGYTYNNSVKNKQSKSGWVLTSLPKQLDDLEALKKLDKYIDVSINNYVNEKDQKELLSKRKKSFYQAFIKGNFTGNDDNYIIVREKVANDEALMYKMTCNLSLVDLKYGLDYNNYNEQEFKEKVSENLYHYFCRTLYIANRDLTSDILYW